MSAKKFIQYSKRMASAVTIFWMVYRIANFVVVLLRPESSAALVDLSTGIDTIMIVNVGFYTGNSISEKAIIGFSQRKSLYGNDDEEEESNG